MILQLRRSGEILYKFKQQLAEHIEGVKGGFEVHYLPNLISCLYVFSVNLGGAKKFEVKELLDRADVDGQLVERLQQEIESVFVFIVDDEVNN